jgi:type IV pilus assembly protein PilP
MTVHRAVIIKRFGLICVAVLAACSQSDPVKSSVKPAATQMAANASNNVEAVIPAGSATLGAGESSVPTPEPEVVSYNPSGRRDPFKSLIVKGDGKKNLEMLPPLQRHEVSDLKYVAVVWGELGTFGMVEIPDGKGYAVRVGTRVGPNRGVVKRITTKDLTVVERYVDFFGETRTRDIVLALRTREEGLE